MAREILLDDEYPEYIESIIDEAYHLVSKEVSHLDHDVFVEYVYGFTDTEIFELGPEEIAESFIEFVQETIP